MATAMPPSAARPMSPEAPPILDPGVLNADRTCPEAPVFTTWIQASPEGVRHGLARLEQMLRQAKVQDDTRGTVLIVLGEVMNNSVEHACRSEGGRIAVAYALREGRLDLAVCDNGGPMPDGLMPKGAAVDVDVDLAEMPEGGFGWFLIRQLVRDLEYRRNDGWNRLSFSIALDAA